MFSETEQMESGLLIYIWKVQISIEGFSIPLYCNPVVLRDKLPTKVY
jgi:hypothetical protein